MIRILRQRFTEIGIENEQSVGDADVLTVQKAIEIAKSHRTTAVSNDTDILVLLMNHWCSTMKDIAFATTKQVNKKKVELSDKIFGLAPSVLLLPYRKKTSPMTNFFASDKIFCRQKFMATFFSSDKVLLLLLLLMVSLLLIV